MRDNLPHSKVKSLILLVVLPFVLTACTASDLPVIGKFFKGKEKPVTLSAWGLWEPKEVFDSVTEDYKSTRPAVTVDYEERSFVTLKSYKESVFTRLSEGSAPDILLVHNSWVPFLVDNLTPAGPKVLSESDYSSMFYPVAKESAVINGKVYGVPISYEGLALVYNRDMFNEEGLSSPPVTWEEFRLDAVKLTKKEGDNIVRGGAAIGTANNIEHFSDILGLLFAQGSLNFPDDLNTQAAADALTFYTNFVLSYKVWSDALPPSVEAFADKKAAMVFVPSWQILNILSRNPQVNIGVAPVPKALDLPGNPINVGWASFWMLVVSKNSSSPEAAWDVLKYVSSEDAQKKLYSEASKVRAFGQPYSLQSLASELSGNSYLEVYVKEAPTAKSGILAARSGNDKEVDILKTAVNSILSGIPASEALSTAQKSLTK